jgi:tyrosine-protein kinase Etk/Wzc
MQTNRQNIDSDDVIHLQDYLNILLHRRKAFILAFSLIFFSVAAYTFLMKPVYEATATLRLREEKGKLSALEELTIGSTSPVNAEIEILKSRTISEKVARRLHLNLIVEKKKGTPPSRFLSFHRKQNWNRTRSF